MLGFALHAEGAPFLALFSAYALSALLGSLSQIPGGLGAFDVTFMLLMSPFCGHAHIVSALLLYRFLYYIVPLALATALLLLTELNGRFAGALGRISFFLPDAFGNQPAERNGPICSSSRNVRLISVRRNANVSDNAYSHFRIRKCFSLPWPTESCIPYLWMLLPNRWMC